MDTQIPKFPEMWTFASHVEITSFDNLKTYGINSPRIMFYAERLPDKML